MAIDFTLLVPEFMLAALGLIVLLVDLFIPTHQNHLRNRIAAFITLAGLSCILLWSVFDLRSVKAIVYDQLIFVDHFSLIFKVIFMGTGIAVTLMSIQYVEDRIRHSAEYYALIVFSILGATIMASAGELLTAYIGLELLSFCLYVLVGLGRKDARTSEASTKYILLGALSSGIFLYGLSILYGTLGTTAFREMDGTLLILVDHPSVIMGFAMLLAGIGFKLAVVPFHIWAPDVYEGAPTPITAHLSILAKAATFALLLRFLAEATQASYSSWQLVLAIISALSMSVGAIVALVQTNIKRLMAYSSITQVGFVTMGLAALTHAGSTMVDNQNSANAIILHIVGYSFSSLAAFMVITMVETKLGKESIKDYAGLSKRSPFLAMVLTAALLSLAGLPIFAGFITKFYLFTSTADAGLIWLVVIGAVASLVSLYYYLGVIRQMYIGEVSEDDVKLVFPRTGMITLLLLFLGTILVGIYPGPIINAAESATSVLGPFI